MKNSTRIVIFLQIVFGIFSIVLLAIIGYGIASHTNQAPDVSVLARNSEESVSVTPTP